MSGFQKVEWIHDEIVEAELKKLRLDWEFIEDVTLRDIDVKSGRLGQSRRESQLREEVWFRYACRMGAGYPFKAIVLYETPKNGSYRYGVAAGSHRLRAFEYLNNDDHEILRSAKCVLSTYVITTPAEDLRVCFERLSNAMEAVYGQSAEEALAQAAEVLQATNLKAKDVAARFGLKPTTLTGRMRALKTQEELEQSNVRTDELTNSHLTKIAALTWKSTRRNAAQVANEYGLTVEETAQMCNTAKMAGEEKGANAVLHDEAEQRRADGRDRTDESTKAKRSRVREKFFGAWRSFQRMLTQGANGKAPQSLKDFEIVEEDVIERLELEWNETETVGRRLFVRKKRTTRKARK